MLDATTGKSLADDVFETDKIEIVAYLKVKGKDPTGYARKNGRVRFYFLDKPACIVLRQEYMIGKGVVVAQDFVTALEWARTAVHQS